MAERTLTDDIRGHNAGARQARTDANLSRWDTPRRVPLDQWLQEQANDEEPPVGSNIIPGHLTRDRVDLCIQLAALVESAGDRLEVRISATDRQREAKRLQVIGEVLTVLLVQPRSVATTEQQRARLLAEGILLPE